MLGIRQLRARQEWQFFAALTHADRPLALLWWAVVLLHSVLPAAFAVAMGTLVAAVQHGRDLGLSLAVIGVVFVLLQVVTPIQTAVSHTLGDRTAAWLYDRLTRASVRPPGMAHLEDPTLAADLTVAREFDRGMTGPPLSYSMDFIAGGLVGMIGGLAAATVLFGFAWWAPILLAAAWLSTHWLLRESAVWFDRNTDEVRAAQRTADYAYRLAVDAPASKELRLFGLVDWTIARFVAVRTRLHQLQYEALTRTAAGLVRADRRRGQPCRDVGAVVGSGRRPDRARCLRHLRAVCRGHVADRVRRSELGARRRGGAGGRRRSSGTGDGRVRRPV
jgi:ATP-binding cassette subfamily B protein